MKARVARDVGDQLSNCSVGDLDDMRRQLASSTERLEVELRSRIRRRQAKGNRTHAVKASEIFDWVTRTCHRAFECEQVVLAVCEPRSGKLLTRSVVGRQDGSRVLYTRYEVDEGIVGWVVRQREVLVVGPGVQPEGYGSFQTGIHPFTAAMVAPLLACESLVGVLQVSNRTNGFRYSTEDLKSLRFFANVAAGICHRAVQIESLQQSIQRLETGLEDEEGELRKAA